MVAIASEHRAASYGAPLSAHDLVVKELGCSPSARYCHPINKVAKATEPVSPRTLRRALPGSRP